MRHPVRDRILILICALAALCVSAGLVAFIMGSLSFTSEGIVFSGGTLSIPLMDYLLYWQDVGMSLRARIVLALVAVVLLVFAALLVGITLPSKRKRSSNFAIQRNENGMVRISLKAIETLVQKCLNQHAELKVVTSSLYSDEETIRVDVHIMLQSDISMPLAISALQKQIKKYLEACSGVTVQEVRVFVDGTTPATEETAKSPYAIPASLLGLGPEALPGGAEDEAAQDAQSVAAAPVAAEPARESEAPEAPVANSEAEDETDETDEKAGFVQAPYAEEEQADEEQEDEEKGGDGQ